MDEAKRHACIKVVEPAVNATMSGWDEVPEINAVVGVCAPHIPHVLRRHGGQICNHMCWDALQYNLLRGLLQLGWGTLVNLDNVI